MSSQVKRMVNENLIAILQEMDSKGISIADLADVLDAFASGEVQEKLTAGDNISISEENVISATDTKYTAGAGIIISDENVISASAGDLYESVLVITALSGQICIRLITQEQITNSNKISILASEVNSKILPVFPGDDIPTVGGVAKIPYLIYGTGNTSANLQLYTINSSTGAVSRNGESITWSASTLEVAYSHKLN